MEQVRQGRLARPPLRVALGLRLLQRLLRHGVTEAQDVTASEDGVQVAPGDEPAGTEERLLEHTSEEALYFARVKG